MPLGEDCHALSIGSWLLVLILAQVNESEFDSDPVSVFQGSNISLSVWLQYLSLEFKVQALWVWAGHCLLSLSPAFGHFTLQQLTSQWLAPQQHVCPDLGYDRLGGPMSFYSALFPFTRVLHYDFLLHIILFWWRRGLLLLVPFVLAPNLPVLCCGLQ